MYSTKELINSIEKVRSYCHNQENCLNCIFHDIDLDCCNIQGIPDDWVYSRFSQDEVQLAKILKKYGVCRMCQTDPRDRALIDFLVGIVEQLVNIKLRRRAE